MAEHILFLTGKLAEKQLRDCQNSGERPIIHRLYESKCFPRARILQPSGRT